MRFTKMQGAGNDYVYVDLFRENIRRYLDGRPLLNLLDKELLY